MPLRIITCPDNITNSSIVIIGNRSARGLLSFSFEPWRSTCYHKWTLEGIKRQYNTSIRWYDVMSEWVGEWVSEWVSQSLSHSLSLVSRSVGECVLLLVWAPVSPTIQWIKLIEEWNNPQTEVTFGWEPRHVGLQNQWATSWLTRMPNYIIRVIYNQDNLLTLSCKVLLIAKGLVSICGYLLSGTRRIWCNSSPIVKGPSGVSTTYLPNRFYLVEWNFPRGRCTFIYNKANEKAG